MTEMEPHKRPKKDVAPRHIPQVVVPVAIGEVREFTRSALSGTSLLNPYVRFAARWSFFEPHVRFSAVDATHSLIELDVTAKVGGAEALLYVQRRAEIDRFFVAIQDELDRRNRWLPHPSADDTSIESAE